MHKGIAIAFLKAIDFCNKLKRTIFDVWCSDPYLSPDAWAAYKLAKNAPEVR
jgi:hypothetical protein